MIKRPSKKVATMLKRKQRSVETQIEEKKSKARRMTRKHFNLLVLMKRKLQNIKNFFQKEMILLYLTKTKVLIN
jgi:hypothetical protein